MLKPVEFGLMLGVAMTACSPALQPAPTAISRPPATVQASPTALGASPVPTAPLVFLPPPGPAILTPMAAHALAVYEKTGCFAGVHDTLVVYPDGRLEFSDRLGKVSAGQASAGALVPLQQILADPSFAQLQELYSAAGADLCVYRIATVVNGQVRTVTTMDAAKTPDILAQAVAALERLRALVQ